MSKKHARPYLYSLTELIRELGAVSRFLLQGAALFLRALALQIDRRQCFLRIHAGLFCVGDRSLASETGLLERLALACGGRGVRH